MTYENAMRWYSFDPFTHISREQATVGALRKAAEGHDVSIQARSRTRKRASRAWQNSRGRRRERTRRA